MSPLTSRCLARRDTPSNCLHSAHQGLDQAAAIRHLKGLLVFLLAGSVKGRRRWLRCHGDRSWRSRWWNRRGGGWSGCGRHPRYRPRVDHAHLRLRFAFLEDGDELVARNGVKLEYKHLLIKTGKEGKMVNIFLAIHLLKFTSFQMIPPPASSSGCLARCRSPAPISSGYNPPG